MSQAMPWIAIVDDDPSVLDALARLLRVHALHARTCTAARSKLYCLKNFRNAGVKVEGRKSNVEIDAAEHGVQMLALARKLRRKAQRVGALHCDP
jgi:FixJ family two-component response regulator